MYIRVYPTKKSTVMAYTISDSENLTPEINNLKRLFQMNG